MQRAGSAAPPSARSTCASRRPPVATAGDGAERLLTGTRVDHGQACRRQARGELVGESSRAVPSWSMPSASQTTTGVGCAAERRGDGLRAPPRRSGAKGCGCTAAAVERAAAGASTLRLSAFAALAVGTISSGRLWPSASAIRRSIMKVRAPHCAAAGPAVVDHQHHRPEPDSAFSRLGLSTGSASARMTSAAAAMRISVSHQGVLRRRLLAVLDADQNAGRRKLRCAAAAAEWCAAATRSPAAPAGRRAARGSGRRCGPSVMPAPPADLHLGLPADSRPPCPAGA